MLSVFLPSIRHHLLENWYESLKGSCNRHPFEVVVCGPKPSIKIPDQITYIEDYGCPTRAAQIAALSCLGDILYHTVDDVLFYPNQISDEIDRFEDITGMRYREGQGYNGYLLPNDYWYAKTAYNLPQINGDWGICVHFLMRTKDFLKYGGFNCQYEYLNHATHDLLFRMQSGGHKYKLSEEEITSADWMPGLLGDHAPIHFAQTTHDDPLFRNNWSNPVPIYIDKDNWKNVPEKWSRRF